MNCSSVWATTIEAPSQLVATLVAIKSATTKVFGHLYQTGWDRRNQCILFRIAFCPIVLQYYEVHHLLPFLLQD